MEVGRAQNCTAADWPPNEEPSPGRQSAGWRLNHPSRLGEAYTAVADRVVLETLLEDVDQALGQASRLLSPYDAHMASFHLGLLRQELLKDEAAGESSADILMLAGSWLLTRVPGLAPVIMRLLLTMAGTAVLQRTGKAVVLWAEARAAEYQGEGQLIDLMALYHHLAADAEDQLRPLCQEMNLRYEWLRGQNPAEKARELVAYCVGVGRVRELQDRCFGLF